MDSGTIVWTILFVYGLPPICSMPQLATNHKTPVSSKGKCPTVEELPQELCMVQSRRDAIPCTVDGDCFLPSQICCPHYCETRVCKVQTSISKLPDDGPRKGTNVGTKPKPTGNVVPTSIKHRQNVPTIDDLAASVSRTAKEQQGGCPSVEELQFEMCMLQTRQEGTSCTTDRDCSRFNQICCPHYCGTRVCKRPGGEDGAALTKHSKPKPTGGVVPTHIKHRQNVPTIDDLAASVSATSKDKRDRCPAVEELPYEMCLMQTRQDAMSCTVDGDCFLPNQICCSHYCGTKVCKAQVGDRGRQQKKTSGGKSKSKPSAKRVPPNIKHRQNVPTIDELAASMRKSTIPKSLRISRAQRKLS